MVNITKMILEKINKNVDLPWDWKLYNRKLLFDLLLLHYILPKCQEVIKVQQYRSIHLLNLSFKIFTKVTNLR
jgi:hypothetical protein